MRRVCISSMCECSGNMVMVGSYHFISSPSIIQDTSVPLLLSGSLKSPGGCLCNQQLLPSSAGTKEDPWTWCHKDRCCFHFYICRELFSLGCGQREGSGSGRTAFLDSTSLGKPRWLAFEIDEKQPGTWFSLEGRWLSVYAFPLFPLIKNILLEKKLKGEKGKKGKRRKKTRSVSLRQVQCVNLLQLARYTLQWESLPGILIIGLLRIHKPCEF